MKKEIEKIRNPNSFKQKNVSLGESNDTSTLQPLIINQVNKNIKGTKSLPYEFSKDTYEVFSNQKNPFMVGILTADTDRIRLDPINTQNFFQNFENSFTYSIEYPHNISAHRKRKLSSPKKTSSKLKNQEKTFRISKTKDMSNEYLSKSKLKEDKFKLQSYIQSFCNHFLKRIKGNKDQLPEIINEIVPLFVKHKIRIRFYEAFRQIVTINELVITLENICNDYELENFELFCSALFVFYNSRKIK
tara:strand:- start:218 stop:955 length:738 start_codon:yes stop_codon:yes gene_type:complete